MLANPVNMVRSSKMIVYESIVLKSRHLALDTLFDEFLCRVIDRFQKEHGFNMKSYECRAFLEAVPQNTDDFKKARVIKKFLLHRINFAYLRELITSRWYWSFATDLMRYLVMNLIVLDRSMDKPSENLAHHYLYTVENLSIGVWGQVSSLRFVGEPAFPMILKIFKNESYEDLAFHEALVLTHIIGPMREYCFNFNVSYGHISCFTTPELPASNEVCGGKQFTQMHMLMDRIPGNTLYRALADRTLQCIDFYGIIIQVFLALKIAKTKGHGFIHNDLHLQNIILRKLEHPRVLVYNHLYMRNKYAVKTQVSYLKVNYIATIIDYGHSYFRMPIGDEDEVTLFYGGNMNTYYPDDEMYNDMWSFLSSIFLLTSQSDYATGFRTRQFNAFFMSTFYDHATEYSIPNRDAMVHGIPQHVRDRRDVLNNKFEVDGFLRLFIGTFQCPNIYRSSVYDWDGRSDQSVTVRSAGLAFLDNWATQKLGAPLFEGFISEPKDEKQIEQGILDNIFLSDSETFYEKLSTDELLDLSEINEDETIRSVLMSRKNEIQLILDGYLRSFDKNFSNIGVENSRTAKEAIANIKIQIIKYKKAYVIAHVLAGMETEMTPLLERFAAQYKNFREQYEQNLLARIKWILRNSVIGDSHKDPVILNDKEIEDWSGQIVESFPTL